jgi:hypothetical protein
LACLFRHTRVGEKHKQEIALGRSPTVHRRQQNKPEISSRIQIVQATSVEESRNMLRDDSIAASLLCLGNNTKWRYKKKIPMQCTFNMSYEVLRSGNQNLQTKE